MTQFVGRHNGLALFSTPEHSVVVDTEFGLVVEAGDTDALLSSRSWIPTGEKFDENIGDLVELSISNLKSRSLVASSNARLYTIPAGVKAEAKKALEWHKENHRGGTPVGLNTAHILANESQIGLEKVRHIAKYFPRHEVDKKGKGYQPGEDGFPSNGRIAWALWGGDAGRKWASTIVEREDKKAVTADGSQIINLPGQNTPDLNDFIDSYEQPETVMPEFLARVCLDGSGIDRLYKIDLDGCTYVWDGSGWDNLENENSTVWDIDNTLDDGNDNLPTVSHILIDPDSAIIIGARLNTNPFKNVSVGDIDADEAELASFAISDIDWDFIDSAIIADASSPVANGSAPAPEPSNVSDINMDGIFDQNPSQQEKPDIKLNDETTPPMDADSVHNVLSNFPMWVHAERKSGVKSKPAKGVHHPLVHKWVAKANGLDMPIQPTHNPEYNPVGAQPVVADGGAPSPATVKQQLDSKKDSAPANASSVSPKTSDVQPLYFAIVSPDDPRAVMNLVSVVPASSSNPQPMVYTRKDGKWIRDPKTLADLKSATPPPVVPLDPNVLQDVLKQVDGIQASALFSYDHALMVMFGPRVNVMETVGNKFFSDIDENFSGTALVAAKGGFDKNRGQAEKLRRYWTFGRGGAKIRWGEPGDWSRCVRHLSKFLGVRAKGYCQLRHHDALGIYTGTHAKMFHEGHGTVAKLARNKRNFASDEFIMEEVLTKNYGKPTVITDKDLMMPMEVIHGQHDHMYDPEWQPDDEVKDALNDPDVVDEMCNYSASEHSADDPCWDGYKQIGFKDKDGKHVPNCVRASGALSASGADLLKKYWTTGKGGDKIRWSEFGDWSRCVRNLDKYFGSRSRGYCALLAQEVNDSWVGDAENKQFFARLGFGSSTSVSAFSTDVINSSERVIELSQLSAKTAELRNRVSLVAAGISVDENAPVEGARFTIPLVIPEEHESGDGRSFEKGAIEIRELPLPLMWQIKTADGHQGSVVVGRIDHMERTEQGIGNAHGVFDTGVYGSEAQRLVQGKFLRGVSADMDKFEAKEIKSKKKDSDEAAESDSVDINNGKLVISKARVMGITIVPKPAFQECQISLAPIGDINQEETMIPNGVYADDADASDALSLVACGFVAGAIPVQPPSEWFKNPNLDKPTPLTVDDTGRVFGHIAAWHVDHIGLSFGTKPPRSRSNYSYFHTGVVRADDGKDYPVGQLTLAGGHADLTASAAEAVKHYDDTASAIADVHAGEDKFGIWVAGALRPSAQPEQIRALRASAPSGDWRPIQGSLELVAVCQVNVPGFPIARARVASGAVMALVAAGASTLAKLKADPVAEMNERIARLEAYSVANRQAELSAIKAKFEDAKTEFGYISKSERDEAAKKGQALPDGSYPIRNVDDLHKAIHAFGRAKPEHKSAVKKHIIKRARQLKASHVIPDSWKHAESDAITASVEAMRSKIASLTAGGAGIPKASDIEGASDAKTARESLDEVKSQNKGVTNKRMSVPVKNSKPDAGDVQKTQKPQQQAADDAKRSKEEASKYTPDTQPRDERGKFREVLARLKGDLHLAGLHGVAAEVKHAEDLHDAGRHEEAIKAGQAILKKVKLAQQSVKKEDSLNRLKGSVDKLDDSLNRVA